MTQETPQGFCRTRTLAAVAARLAPACLLVAAAAALPAWLRHTPLSGEWTAAHAAPFAADRPPLRVSVEPSEGEFVVYEPVAPQSSKHQETGQIALLLKIENAGRRAVKLNKVTIGYAGTGGPSANKEIVLAKPLEIGAGAPQFWHQVRDSASDTVIYLPEGFAPNVLTVRLYCDGFDLPFLLMKPMKRHTSPVAGGSYLFPARAQDLRFGEYWQTASKHGTSAYGSQLFGYDMGATGWDEKEGRYWEGLPGAGTCTDGGYTWVKKNEDYRVYGKPVYAMADGVVRHVRDGVPENPMAWRLTGDASSGCASASVREKSAKCELPAGADKSRFVGSGNHVLIQSGDELHHYAHLQPGSLGGGVRRNARVEAGDFLGLVGNSGCSTAPHIHIDVLQIHDQTCVESASPGCRDNNPPDVVSLRPLIFHDLYTVAVGQLKGRDPNPSVWAKANDQAIPAVSSAIWPSAKEPCYYPPGKGEITYFGIARHDYQGLFERVTGCGYYPVWADGFEVNGRNYFNAIFRSAAPPAGLVADASVSLARLNEMREDLVDRKGYRISFIDSYPQDGAPLFSCIFVKDGGPRTAVTPSLTEVQHENRLEAMKKNGWVPMQVSAVSVSSIRLITTLYAKKDVGRWVIKSLLTSREYDDLYNSDEMRGMEVVHLNAYTYGNSPRFAAVWHQKTPYASVSAKHNLSGDEYQSLYNDRLGKGYATQIVTGYESNNRMEFGGVWAK